MEDEKQNNQINNQQNSTVPQPEKEPGFIKKITTAGKSVVKRFFPGIPPASERPSITIEKMYEIGNKFAEKVFSIPEIAEKLKASKMILKMEYYDPENWGDDEPQITIDFTQDTIKIYTGLCDINPIVTLRMHADTAHRFWMQKVNLMAAITKKEIQAIGPIPQVMKLLPIIKPAFELYKQTLRELELSELLSYPPEKDEIITKEEVNNNREKPFSTSFS